MNRLSQYLTTIRQRATALTSSIARFAFRKEPAAVIAAIYAAYQAALLVQPSTAFEWAQLLVPAIASALGIRQLVTPTGKQ